ncbi:MAG: MaoC/PaaZ C-terminal domain-containing protein [Bacteroidota bacterium]
MKFTEGQLFYTTFNVSEDVYDGFISTFHDRNPLHTDATFAREKGFKDKVMHGNILNGFLSCFIGEHLPYKNVIIHTQEIQYKKPVYLNDILSFTAEIISVTESVNVIEFKFFFENSEGIKVAKGKIQIGLLL